MKTTFACFIPLTALLCLGCESPGGAYVKQHPELSPGQRKIFLERKVSDPEAVAGLTKEQIRVAMGEPTQFDNTDGSETWVYIRTGPGPGSSGGSFGQQMETPGAGGSGMAPPMGEGSGAGKGSVRTAIIFDGDRAVRATRSYE
jgi:hypothetical protein